MEKYLVNYTNEAGHTVTIICSNYVEAYVNYSQFCNFAEVPVAAYLPGCDIEPHDTALGNSVFLSRVDNAGAFNLLIGSYCTVCDDFIDPVFELN